MGLVAPMFWNNGRNPITQEMMFCSSLWLWKKSVCSTDELGISNYTKWRNKWSWFHGQAVVLPPGKTAAICRTRPQTGHLSTNHMWISVMHESWCSNGVNLPLLLSEEIRSLVNTACTAPSGAQKTLDSFFKQYSSPTPGNTLWFAKSVQFPFKGLHRGYFCILSVLILTFV